MLSDYVFIIAGKVVTPGDTVRDFRGQEWEFLRISRYPAGSSTGRVLVRDEFKQTREFHVESVLPPRGTLTREFFPSVFDGVIAPFRPMEGSAPSAYPHHDNDADDVLTGDLQDIERQE